MGTDKPKHPGYANGHVEFNCRYCGKTAYDKKSHYKRKKRHYCSADCYAKDRSENWKREEQPTYKNMTPYLSHRKYVKNNPERIKHLKARRYARKKNANGFHTLKEWDDLKQKHNQKCAICGNEKKLTKDHIIPLSKGGSDYIENIQPLCRNCNSKKWNHIYENPELLEK